MEALRSQLSFSGLFGRDIFVTTEVLIPWRFQISLPQCVGAKKDWGDVRLCIYSIICIK